MPKRRGTKIVFVTGGVLVLVAGVFIGAFLVLQSMRAEGQLIPTTQEEGVLQSEATRSLLGELSRLQTEGASFSGGEGNLTQRFLDTIARESEGLEEDIATSPEFIQSTVLPFLQDSKALIIPVSSGISVKQSVKISDTEYAKKLSESLFILAGAWQEVLRLSPENADSEKFSDILNLLKQNHTLLEDIGVPPSYADLHRDSIRLSGALQQLVQHGILREGNDPLRGILAIALIDDIGALGGNVMKNFSSIIVEN